MATSVPTRISLQNILVATDFSPCSEAVLPYVRSLALHYGSTVYLTHVISLEAISVDPFMTEAARRNAERWMGDLDNSQVLEGISRRCIVEEGPTWGTLERIVQQEHINLIIAGTHGRTGLKRLVMGSVDEDIFRHAPCPVLTLGPKICERTKSGAGITHVLLPTDMNPDNPGAMLYATFFAAEHRARLTLLHAAPAAAQLPPSEELLRMIPPHTELSHAPEVLLDVGHPAEVILDVVASRGIDLIVMGAHHPKGMATHVMDVAYHVICEAPCPVLTVGAEYGRNL